MKKLVYGTLAALTLLGSTTAAFAGCDSVKMLACGEACDDRYPNPQQTQLYLGCITGCRIATDCMIEA